MITIFDIPLLMDQICRHLSPHQIRRCLRVCKAWAVAFNPYQWDHVFLIRKSNGGSLVEDLSEAEKQLLVQNVYWIRSLRIHFSEELLNVPDCVNLRAVSFRDLDDYLDNRDTGS
ncbi:hypothetical protein EMPS_00046 [Entomortierella parvispora]|uniref:F-box domain-containing protein n=1 Tax=Entomortierella parvispora TaxID=205924 RepID=A0A9P3GZ01_9FUNG|nr:hypothetical protein EMPS_00046 [Entomortierella parvispora]